SQRLEIETPLQPLGRWNIVSRTTGFQLVDKPKPLLRERQRQFAAAWHGNQRRRRAATFGLANALNGFRETGNSGCFKQTPERHLDLKGFSDSGNHLSSQQRVAAQFKKTVKRANFLHAEALAEDPSE